MWAPHNALFSPHKELREDAPQYPLGRHGSEVCPANVWGYISAGVLLTPKPVFVLLLRAHFLPVSFTPGSRPV